MEIKRIACVGAGLIGQSWAELFATRGYPVVLHDIKNKILANAIENIKVDLEFLAEKNLMDRDDVESSLARVETTTDLAKAVGTVDYVQESVPESYDVKKNVFKKLDVLSPEHTILASSSSGLLMTEIQKVTERPQRCVMAHPWNPPLLIPLVEIAGGEKTAEETIQITYQLMLRVNKVPVILRKEVSGYIANRIQAAVLREAVDLVDKGVASVEDINRAVRAGPGIRWAIMGPFLIHHLGGKGIERFFKILGSSYAHRWRSMATWTSIPPSAAKKVIDEVYQLEIVKSKTMEELIDWRNNKLAELLKILGF